MTYKHRIKLGKTYFDALDLIININDWCQENLKPGTWKIGEGDNLGHQIFFLPSGFYADVYFNTDEDNALFILTWD